MVSCPPAPSRVRDSARPTIVLVVEDEILIRTAVAEYLRISGYAVVEAADAAEALTVFVSGEPIDCIICDVDMPGSMDGLKLAHWIKQHHSALPLLLTSGRGIAVAAAERLAFSFLSKPYRLEELADRLRLALASKDSTQDDLPVP